ncbi:hypothetical protein [Streptomyces sp. URMC 129]|uniref:hypothetical protein n=1 Tax=Streptomyces sp. URMC 129 TaxID=3423407 RepID=UPI003F19F753
MSFQEVRQIHAEVTGRAGRVRAWSTESEPGLISLAVPGDRAQLAPEDARALAAWLEERAVEEEHRPLRLRPPAEDRPWDVHG